MVFCHVSDEGGPLCLGEIEVCYQNKNNAEAYSHVKTLMDFFNAFV